MAGIFVRVYNEQPGFGVTHEVATAFCKGLVTWINSQSLAPTFCKVLPQDGERLISVIALIQNLQVLSSACENRGK